MKLSFSTLGTPFADIGGIVGYAVKNCYQGIELRAVSGTVDLASLEAFKGGGLRQTAKQIKDAGIETVCVGTSVSFNKAGREAQTEVLEAAKFSMGIANALKCPYIRTFGGPLIPTQSYTESLKWIREGYELLCELSAKEKVTPLIETHDDFSTSARVLDIVGAVSAQNLGVVWDILHPYRYGEAMEATYEALRERIHHVHVKDSANFSPAGFDLPLLGEGKLPVDECVGLLKSGGYDGYYCFEWEKLWHPEIPEPEAALPSYVQYMARYA
ncbi:MAG: sugar phosphate isomerase/epimerase [Clostridiales bacterium]|nr:sugar phosphate isomerase/epimerase [Clostridiales bacterium]